MREFWEDLAGAVVWQAAGDYVTALNQVRYGRSWLKSRARKKSLDLAEFFRSEWCRRLTGLDGEMIMNELEEEFENDDRGIFASRFNSGSADFLSYQEAR